MEKWNNKTPSQAPADLRPAGGQNSVVPQATLLESQESGNVLQNLLFVRVPNESQFRKELKEFCDSRGTVIEFEHSLGCSTKKIKLYDLFEKVWRFGGYDALSRPDDGAARWRGVCKELGVEAHQSFTVKSLYYQHLLGYEINKLHNQEPPVESRENITAIGANLLQRTNVEYPESNAQGRIDLANRPSQYHPNIAVEVFNRSSNATTLRPIQPRPAPKQGPLGTGSGGVYMHGVQGLQPIAPAPHSNVQNCIGSGLHPFEQIAQRLNRLETKLVKSNFDEYPEIECSKTGIRHCSDIDVTKMATNTRSSLREGLRQAPKANQAFTPNTPTVRQTRSSANNTSSPQPTSSHTTNVTPSSNPNSSHLTLDNFEGNSNKQVPMSMREVTTPGNRPGLFVGHDGKGKLAKQPDFYDPYYPLRFLEVPKSDHIYKRAFYGLQSGIPDEVDFALYHLVQISNQRWDKFKFEGFPLLAETLMEKAMEITLLCTGVKWELEHDFNRPMDRVNVLNSLHSTHDILDRIKRIPVTIADDTLETEEFNHHLRNIKEATLVLRNMVLLKENAVYIARYAKGLLRDFLVVLLNIPNQSRLNEIKNDALDIAEEVTKYMTTHANDPLWISLLDCLQSSDRAHIIRSLLALTHFSTEMERPTLNRAMEGVPKNSLQQLFYHTLLEQDKDILSGTLDFWYQFSLIPDNIETMIEIFSLPIVFVPRMITLLSYEGRPGKKETVLQEEKVAPAPLEIPRVPPELFKDLMELSEPERSSRWLRCCFVEDPECDITQIALWQGYQSRFADSRIPGGGVLPAAEFIKNVSTTFTNAQAQVINGPGTQTKFIIKGIRPLETALTFQGFPYLYCKWTDNTKPSKQCKRAFATPTDLRSHVFQEHMGLKELKQAGHYNLDKADSPIHICQWDNCAKFRSNGPSSDTAMVAEHVASHLPPDRDPNAQPPNNQREILQPRIVRKWFYMDTPVTEEGEPFGIAYKAALIMRNISWNLPSRNAGPDHNNLPWKKAVFLSNRAKIIDAWDRNRSLRTVLTELIMQFENEEA